MPTKATSRRAALAERQALGAAEVAARSGLLTAHLFEHFDVAAWHWLHVFLPIAARHEPDTWRVIHRVWADERLPRLAAPAMQPGTRALRHYELTPATELLINHWGIAEPRAALTAEVRPAQLDAVLVPLLAADHRGHRVGYGGGYYDRFLAQCPPATRFIGLSLLEQHEPELEISDVEPTDVRLHALLTPAGVRHFGSSPSGR